MAIDPVCKMNLEPAKAAAKEDCNGQVYYFCSESCHKAFHEGQLAGHLYSAARCMA